MRVDNRRDAAFFEHDLVFKKMPQRYHVYEVEEEIKPLVAAQQAMLIVELAERAAEHRARLSASGCALEAKDRSKTVLYL